MPVSVACIYCELLEHIVWSNSIEQLEANNILTDKQHVFREGRSCKAQLININNDWAKSLDIDLHIDSFVLDFKRRSTLSHTSY